MTLDESLVPDFTHAGLVLACEFRAAVLLPHKVKSVPDHFLNVGWFLIHLCAEAVQAMRWNHLLRGARIQARSLLMTAHIAQKAGWEDQTRIFEGTVWTLPLKGHLVRL